jgi:hypothetical protein
MSLGIVRSLTGAGPKDGVVCTSGAGAELKFSWELGECRKLAPYHRARPLKRFRVFNTPQNGSRVDAAIPELEPMPVAQTLRDNGPMSSFGDLIKRGSHIAATQEPIARSDGTLSRTCARGFASLKEGIGRAFGLFNNPRVSQPAAQAGPDLELRTQRSRQSSGK